MIGVVAVGALAAIGAVAAGADDTEPPASNSKPTIGALAKAGDRLPAVAAVEVEALAPAGTDVAETVEARTTEDGTFYLTSTPDGACLSLVSEGAATVQRLSLASIERAAGEPSQNMILTDCETGGPDVAPDCGSAVLYGVVPDGVASVALDTADGRVDHVVNNVYVLSVPEAQAMAPLEYRIG